MTAAGSGPSAIADVARRPRRFVVVRSRFNEQVTERLLAGAIACLRDHGVGDDDIDVVSVPGAWELPFAASLAARRGEYAGIVAIGCVIRGDTPHFDYVAGPAADGLAHVALETSIPVAFGLLTTNTAEQALDRAGGRQGNKGWDAALSALEMAGLAAEIEGREALWTNPHPGPAPLGERASDRTAPPKLCDPEHTTRNSEPRSARPTEIGEGDGLGREGSPPETRKPRAQA